MARSLRGGILFVVVTFRILTCLYASTQTRRSRHFVETPLCASGARPPLAGTWPVRSQSYTTSSLSKQPWCLRRLARGWRRCLLGRRSLRRRPASWRRPTTCGCAPVSAFAALCRDATVCAWGAPATGGAQPELHDIVAIQANCRPALGTRLFGLQCFCHGCCKLWLDRSMSYACHR